MRSSMVMLIVLLLFVPGSRLDAQPDSDLPFLGGQADTNIYWYNPDADIYYDPASGLYYWYENGRWIADEYPPDVYIDPDRWVMFSSDASVPYVLNDQIVSYYDDSGYFPLYGSDILVFNIGVAPYIQRDFFRHHYYRFNDDEKKHFKHGDRDRHDRMYRSRYGHHFDPKAHFRERQERGRDYNKDGDRRRDYRGYGGSTDWRGTGGTRGGRVESGDVSRSSERQREYRPRDYRQSDLRRSGDMGRRYERDAGTRGYSGTIRRENVSPQRDSVRSSEIQRRPQDRGMQQEQRPSRSGNEMRGTRSESQGTRGSEMRGTRSEGRSEGRSMHGDRATMNRSGGEMRGMREGSAAGGASSRGSGTVGRGSSGGASRGGGHGSGGSRGGGSR